MTRKLEIGISAAALLIGVFAWLLPISSPYFSSNTASEYPDQKEPFYTALLPTPTLMVSGTGARVRIMVSPDDARFSGGEISATGAESTVYLKRGQKIKLDLSGTGARVLVQSGLMPYIKIISTSTGGSVREL